MSIMTGALDADQQALNVVANNVANANTPGYTQEVPTWQQSESVQIGGQTDGMGVTETGATSLRDRVLNERLDQQQQLASASGTRLSSLQTVQALFTPDSGTSSSTAGDIGSDLTSFFASFSSLEADPTNTSLRESVLSSAKTLSADISGAANSLNAQQLSIDQEASGITSQVNSLTTSIAQLNQQIETTSPNADAGTLEDQRQEDISQLSKLVGINQITTENNGLSITTTSGALLVAGANNYQLSNGMVDGVTHFFVASTATASGATSDGSSAGGTDITAGLTSGGGELGGYLTVRDQDIPNVLTSLDQLAYGVSTAINTANNAGTTISTGTVPTPNNIFSTPPTNVAGAAAAMSVVMTDPSLIAAAGAGDATGDDSNAVVMANLGNQAIINSSETPTNFYSTLVATLGSTVSQAQTENTAQSASVTQLQTQSDALSGVSLDDEASDMSTMERAYQSASQAFTILSNIMNSALNLGESTTVS
jgi:flagellar hook-associated protein 1 FlgK